MSLSHEFESLRLDAYLDHKKIPTIGWGCIRYEDGRQVKLGDTITRDYADALFNDYMMREVTPYILALKRSFTSRQKEALESLIYNIGGTAWKKSKCCAAIVSGDWATAFKEWDWGVTDNDGFRRRRAAELHYFFGDKMPGKL